VRVWHYVTGLTKPSPSDKPAKFRMILSKEV